MVGSNQRPLPCEVRALLLYMFAVVQNARKIAHLPLEAFVFVRRRLRGLVYQVV
jgi:hypothetical protein